MSSLVGFLLSERQEEERRTLKEKNLFSLFSKSAFLKEFRVSKEVAKEILNKIIEKMTPDERNMSPEVKLLACLHLLGTGYCQQGACNVKFAGVSKKTLSRLMRQMIPLIIGSFHREILFPANDQERDEVALGFKNLGPFEKVLGVIGCTQISIRNLEENSQDFLSSRGCHSLNVQMVCDSKKRILSIDPKFPGQVTNQVIWRGSRTFEAMKQLCERRMDFYLLGGPSYTSEPFLLKPILNAPHGSSEEKYTQAHNRVRSTVDRAFEALKVRFRILSEGRMVTDDPIFAANIVNCCAILHNMCLRYGVPPPNDEEQRKCSCTEDEGKIKQRKRRLNDEEEVTMPAGPSDKKLDDDVFTSHLNQTTDVFFRQAEIMADSSKKIADALKSSSEIIADSSYRITDALKSSSEMIADSNNKIADLLLEMASAIKESGGTC